MPLQRKRKLKSLDGMTDTSEETLGVVEGILWELRHGFNYLSSRLSGNKGNCT